MNRDFDTADRVQLELAEKGVYINDRTKEWRADGVQFILYPCLKMLDIQKSSLEKQ
jgi:hypothetical protein